MLLHNLQIKRILIHQIFKRDEEGNKIKPLQSHEYTLFNTEAMQTFISRVRTALGDDSKAVQMEIVNQESSALPSLVDTIVEQDNDTFVVSSYDIAMKLTDVQHSRSIPGGIIVVFDGTYGVGRKKFLGIIKAEIHSGYEKETHPITKEISLKFVEELLLTPGTRLYKTAGFFENDNFDASNHNLNEKWVVMVSDYQINKTDGKAAAYYFYYDFLGCGYPQTSAKTTRQFYEHTKKFIENLKISQYSKIDYFNALTTYLKMESSSTVSASEFAGRYFDIDTQDKFVNYIIESGLPSTAFTKDVDHIISKLKYRKVSFTSNINITAPPQVFKDLVTIESIQGDNDGQGKPTEWTKVIIKDRISKQE